MGSKSVKSPPSPDPGAVASAQAGANLQTSIGNTWMQNANVKTPWGNSTTKQQTTKKIKYDENGTQVVDKHGNPTYTHTPVTKTVTDPNTGKSMQVPVFEHETKLSKNQQKLLDQQEGMGIKLNTMADGQMDRLNTHLSTPFNLDGIDEVGDFESYRAKTEDALMSRLNEDFDTDYNKMETRLINQGAARGSAAFDSAEKSHGRNVNDARTQAFLASGAEGRAAGSYDMGRRNQAISERMMMRNQPINEITALMNGGQVTAPQMPQFNGSSMSEVPVGQYMYQDWNNRNQQATQKAAANGAMWSNAGNAVAGMFKWSDARLKRHVERIGTVNGRNLYRYQYVWGEWGIGVMAQENLDIAVVMPNGFMAVDYGRL